MNDRGGNDRWLGVFHDYATSSFLDVLRREFPSPPGLRPRCRTAPP
jgi:hypothetical protein